MIELVASKPHYRSHAASVMALIGGPDVTRSRDRRSDTALVVSHRDAVRARRWGYRRIALLEHGIGQSYDDGHGAYPGGNGRGFVGLFLSPNDTAAARDRATYPRTPVEIVGSPRLDTLPRRDAGDGLVVATSFHWDGGGRRPPELRTALSYYAAALRDLSGALPGVTFLGHSHPFADLTDLYRRLGWEYVRDFDDICRRADLYIADNTSTLYEFASTGRPVVALNAPWYRRDVDHGLRFWEAADIGIQVDAPADLVSAIERALALRVDDVGRRELALDHVYAHRTGGAQRAADVISNWAKAHQ